jgi:hypothetical protein
MFLTVSIGMPYDDFHDHPGGNVNKTWTSFFKNLDISSDKVGK